MKVSWIAPYDLRRLLPELSVERSLGAMHPCSWIVNLLAALEEQPEIRIDVVTFSHHIRTNQVVRRGRITFHVLKRGIPFLSRGYPSWFPIDAIFGFRQEIARAKKVLHAIKPDLVHAHGTEGANALAGLAISTPCLISIQGVIGELVKVEPTWRFKLLRFWEETAIKKGRFFGCRTHFDSGYVKRLNPLAKVYDLPEAINPRFFEIIWEPIPRPNVLFVGSLVKRKGIEVLLEAFAMVRGKTPNARLTVVGEGAKEYKETLQIKAKNLGILSAVDFVGAKSADQIAQLHRESQMLILPSESENSPNSIAEALVSGLPVIATRVGGIPSMISDGETGFLVPPNDPRSLAEAILKLSSSVALQLAISRRAINMARPRHWPATVAEVTVSAYKDILST